MPAPCAKPMNGTPSNACAATSPAPRCRTNVSRSMTAGRSCIDTSTLSVTGRLMSCSTPSNSCGTSVCRTPSGQPPAVQIGNPADLASPVSPPLEVPLAARARSVPRPRGHLTRYHGVFAPNCKHRHRIIPNPGPQSVRESPASRPAPMRWMQRLGRVFHIDIEHCGVCGGTLRVIACIETPLEVPLATRGRSLIETILTHLAARETGGINPPPRTAAPSPASPTSGLPITDLVLTAPARRCATAPLRLVSRALRSPAPSRHAFLFAGAKSHHPDRDSSALVPISNPTTTGPILPQPSQSTLYSSYPSRRRRLPADGERQGRRSADAGAGMTRTPCAGSRRLKPTLPAGVAVGEHRFRALQP